MISRLAIPCSLITLIVIAILRANPQSAIEIDQYHERVALEINSIPVEFGDWVSKKVDLPNAATSLLHPNALVARQYFNKDRGIFATLMIVQCRDARDMGGHYPPVCYPGNGWMQYPEKPARNETIENELIRVYSFHRVAGRVEREITIYNLFAFPTGALSTSMSDVRKLSANYEYRKYGAAQLQVMISGDVDQQDHTWIVEEMLKIARPAIDAVLDAQLKPNHGEGGTS